MSVVSNTLCSHFFDEWSYTHALTKLHTEVWSYELNFSRLWVSIMHGLAWSELNYCTWFALSVSSLPLSVMVRSCHLCVNLSRLHSSGFTPTLRSGSSLSPTWQQAGISHARNFQRTFGLHEIFKCAPLKFMVYGRKQTYIHTYIHTYTQLPQCSHASVGLAQARPNYVHLQTEEI